MNTEFKPQCCQKKKIIIIIKRGPWDSIGTVKVISGEGGEEVGKRAGL
jgi:hypothetical protein